MTPRGENRETCGADDLVISYFFLAFTIIFFDSILFSFGRSYAMPAMGSQMASIFSPSFLVRAREWKKGFFKAMREKRERA